MELFSLLISSHGEFDFYTRVDSEVGDALDIRDETYEIDDSLVDSHFESIPGFRTLTARWFSDSDDECLSGHSHGSLDFNLFSLLSSADDLSSSLLDGLLVLAGKGDSDTDLLDILLSLLGFLLCVHNCSVLVINICLFLWIIYLLFVNFSFWFSPFLSLSPPTSSVISVVNSFHSPSISWDL